MPGMSAVVTREKIPHPATDAIDLATDHARGRRPGPARARPALADGQERSCADLQRRLGLPASTGSYHLRLLREAGLTRTRAAGTQRFISLRRDDLEARFPGLVAVLTR